MSLTSYPGKKAPLQRQRILGVLDTISVEITGYANGASDHTMAISHLLGHPHRRSILGRSA